MNSKPSLDKNRVAPVKREMEERGRGFQWVSSRQCWKKLHNNQSSVIDNLIGRSVTFRWVISHRSVRQGSFAKRIFPHVLSLSSLHRKLSPAHDPTGPDHARLPGLVAYTSRPDSEILSERRAAAGASSERVAHHGQRQSDRRQRTPHQPPHRTELLQNSAARRRPHLLRHLQLPWRTPYHPQHRWVTRPSQSLSLSRFLFHAISHSSRSITWKWTK